jgi:DNA-binding MarR family transcriptional regulator
MTDMAPPDHGADDVAAIEREMRHLLSRARRLAAEMSRSIHPELDPALYALLVDLEEIGPVRAADLAEARGVTKGVISRQVLALEHRRMVTRQTDDADGRAQILVVTATGAEAVAMYQARRRGTLQHLLQQASRDELALISQALRRFNDLLE